MSSITAYQDAVDAGVVVVQDLAAFATPWEPGVTFPDPAFDADGILDSVVEDLGLLSLGRIDQKGAASLSPDAKYNEIMGYGALAPRRRILQSEGMAIAIAPQEARKITHRIQANLNADAFVGTSTGGFRAKKTAGVPPKYWSILLLGLDFNDRTGNEVLPWWFFPKTGSDKGGKVSLSQDSPMMPEQNLQMFQDGDNLYEFGIDGAGWAELAPSLGWAAPKTFTVTVTGSPTGGTFTLSVGGQTTSGVAFNATSTNVRSALEALSSVGSGHVTVTGSAGGPYTVVFDETVSGTLTGSGASLTGGTSPDVVIS